MLAVAGQGRDDQLPALDVAYLKFVGLAARLGRRATEDEVREFFAPYGEYAGLAGCYALQRRFRDDGEAGEDRRGVARGALARPLPHPAREGHRAAVHRRLHPLEGRRHVPLRRLRRRAVQLGHEVRLGHRLAELHRAGRGRRRRASRGPQPRNGPHRGDLRPLRRPPGPRLPGRPRRRAASATASTRCRWTWTRASCAGRRARPGRGRRSGAAPGSPSAPRGSS